MALVTLKLAAGDAEQVAAGLQIFLDHIPQNETDLEDCMEELLALGAALKELAEDHPDYHVVSPRLHADVDLITTSLGLTLQCVRRMFGETRHIKYTGERPYRRAWEDLADYFGMIERGPSLVSRLETYDLFLRDILDMLRGVVVEPEDIVRNRLRVESLLQVQQPRQQPLNGFAYHDPPVWPQRPVLPQLRTHPFPSPPIMSPIWSEDSDNAFPPAPEPPSVWNVQSPIVSNFSGSTWSSNSSAARSPINHWATKVLDGKHSKTPFRAPGEPTDCYGTVESSGCLHRLAAENFLEVLRLPLESASFYVKIFWRPSDHRVRLLCTRKSTAGLANHFCIPLTALKLTRQASTLLLWRHDRELREFKIWGCLSFQFYESLVLFYCAFSAMKSQDHAKFNPILADKYQNQKGREEKEEYAGAIQDDDFLHALRIYRDRDSGCIRLEARPLRGEYTATPIWTAFITQQIKRKQWMLVKSIKMVQLSELHPYSFCPNYSPPRSKSGKFRLLFTSSKDAQGFIEVITALAARV